MNKYSLIQAFKVTIPVLFGYLSIGIPFGLMLVSAGYPWWMAPIMSLTMYAGAGQYMAVGLFAAGTPLSAILVTMLMVNIRHIVYGLSLIEPFKKVGKWKPYLIFALTDETYALLTGTAVPRGLNPGKFYGAIAIFDHLYWIIGSIIGAIAGSLINFSFDGIDFALTALFIVLLIEQLKKTKNPIPPIMGGVASVIAFFVFGPSNMLIAALAIGIGFLMIFQKPLQNLSDKQDSSSKENTKGEIENA